MAVDDAVWKRDMYGPRPGPEDVRVQFGDWVYYIRAVKWKRDLEFGSMQASGETFIDVLMLAVVALRRAWSPRRPWIVGVVRIGDVATWKDRRPEVVHQETLAGGQSPGSRIEGLAGRARQGDFAPAC